MRIKNVRIKNYRSFEDVTINIDNYTSLVGPNGAGKSTVLSALNIFFREAEGANTSVVELDVEDFHNRNTQFPIEITVTFDKLNEDAIKELTAYYRQGELVVSSIAHFNIATGTAPVKQYGQRNVMAAFKEFFRLYDDGKPIAELKTAYEAARINFSDLPKPGTKASRHNNMIDFSFFFAGEME